MVKTQLTRYDLIIVVKSTLRNRSVKKTGSFVYYLTRPHQLKLNNIVITDDSGSKTLKNKYDGSDGGSRFLKPSQPIYLITINLICCEI